MKQKNSLATNQSLRVHISFLPRYVTSTLSKDSDLQLQRCHMTGWPDNCMNEQDVQVAPNKGFESVQNTI